LSGLDDICELRLMFHVYVLENSKGRLYIGHTEDLDRRLHQHNSPEGKEHLGKYTHRNGPWSLVGSESYATRSEAMRRSPSFALRATVDESADVSSCAGAASCSPTFFS
jgi:predicted GIY-YIG superfamily endonuclease